MHADKSIFKKKKKVRTKKKEKIGITGSTNEYEAEPEKRTHADRLIFKKKKVKRWSLLPS